MATPLETFLLAQEEYLRATGWAKQDKQVGRFNSWRHPELANPHTQPAAVSLQTSRDGYMPLPVIVMRPS